MIRISKTEKQVTEDELWQKTLILNPQMNTLHLETIFQTKK